MEIKSNQGKFNGDEIFSILIPTWNNLDYLKLCVESIERNSHFNHQIIVHANEGNDGTLDWLENKGLTYTYSKQNAGICYGMNAARTLVKTDYIVYMNDDMYALPDWDKFLFDEIKSLGTELFFLSATMIEPQTNNKCAIEFNCGNDLSTFDETKLLENFSKLEKTDWSGATWPPNVVHKNVWDLVGGYSIEFSPGMYSDPDFSMKLWQAGVRYFKGLGKSRVYHFASKSTKKLKQKKEGYYKFIDKWGITAGTFTQKFLHRCEPFTGRLPEVQLSQGDLIKGKIKRTLNGILR